MKKLLKLPEFFPDQKISSLGTEEESNEGESTHKILMRENVFKTLLFALSKNSRMHREI